MSEIRFIEAQGDLLERVITQATIREADPGHRRLRWFRRRKGRSLAAGVALALVVAGCAVAASGLLDSSERLALGKVNCYYSTGVHLPGAGGFDPIVTGAPLIAGETPAQVCQAVFQENKRTYLSEGVEPPRHSQVLSCEETATSTVVFVGAGTAFVGPRAALIGSASADQCQQLGLKPVPTNLAAATTKLRTLVTTLQKTYESRDCWAPDALQSAARSVLIQQGFTGWRVTVAKPDKNADPIGLGNCGVFLAGDNTSIDGSDHTIALGLGLSRSLNALNNRVGNQLSAELWRHCYSRVGVRTLVNQAFAGSGLKPKIAITTNPDGGTGFSYGSTAYNRHYAADCPVLAMTWPTLDGRSVLVWLNARNGQRLRRFTLDPPLTDFHS